MIFFKAKNHGAESFFQGKNHGAESFFERKNHGADSIFNGKNHGAESFFTRKDHGALTFFSPRKIRLPGPGFNKFCSLPYFYRFPLYRKSDRAKSVIWANYRYPGQLQICNPGKSQICTAPLRESSPSSFRAAQMREN